MRSESKQGWRKRGFLFHYYSTENTVALSHKEEDGAKEVEPATM